MNKYLEKIATLPGVAKSLGLGKIPSSTPGFYSSATRVKNPNPISRALGKEFSYKDTFPTKMDHASGVGKQISRKNTLDNFFRAGSGKEL